MQIRPPDVEYVAPPLTHNSELVESAQRHYGGLVRQLAEYHTGEQGGVFTLEQEHQRFAEIERGTAAQAEIEVIDDSIRQSSDSESLEALVAARRTAWQQVKLGERATTQVVEVNLRYAHFMARASVGITPVYRKSTRSQMAKEEQAYAQAVVEGNKSGRKRPKRFVGAYGSIANLATLGAELDDRMQNGAEGLMKAVQNYDRSYNAKLITFADSAIHGTIERNMSTSETMETCGPRLPNHILYETTDKWKTYATSDLATVDPALARANGDTTEKLKQLQHWYDAQYQVRLDDVEFPYAAKEEDGDSAWHVPPVLGMEEVWPDPQATDPQTEAMKSGLRQELQATLKELGEREAGVLRLRFGLTDGKTYTYDEIGNIYGITRGRVHQIERKTLEKIRELEQRFASLQHYLEVGDSTSLKTKTAQAALESWRVSLNKEWEAPVQEPPPAHERLQRGSEEYKAVYQAFVKIATGSVYHYQKSFAEAMRTPYPKGLCHAIEEKLGDLLTPQHIEDFWNSELPSFVQTLEAKLRSDIDYNRFGQMVSMLLSTRMEENDSIQLQNPDVENRYGYLGAWAKQGLITVVGNPGDYTGLKMSQSAIISVIGNVGSYFGAGAQDHSLLEVTGNAGNYVGKGAKGDATIIVAGHAGVFPGQDIRQQASVTVSHRTIEAQQALANQYIRDLDEF